MVIALILLFHRKDFVALHPSEVLHPFPPPHASFHNHAYRLHRISDEELGMGPLAQNPRPPLSDGCYCLLRIRGLDVRQAISSAKTLAPLAMPVSQTAGLESTPELRSQLLGQLLAQTYKATIDVAEGISDVAGRDVQSWMVAQLMQTLAQEISNHWIRDGKTDVNRYSQDFVSLFRDNRALLGSAMELMSNTAYQEVRSDRTVAEDRFAVSTMNAAWSLRGHVHDKRLLVDSA